MISRIVTAKRDGICECGCAEPFINGARLAVLGQPGEKPMLIILKSCADELRISLINQFEREKRRKR
jgi:hypothetical protein